MLVDITQLTERLGRVREFNVEVCSVNDKPAAGLGTVSVEYPFDDCIVWRENGRWNKRFNHLEFSNVYRWSKMSKGHLGLEHLRYGDQHPVHLVELKKTNNNSWDSVYPHLCGKDRYQLKLSVNSHALTLVWHISGPDKDQISRVCYI